MIFFMCSVNYINYSEMMKSIFGKMMDWLRSLFFNKELELCIVGLQYAGKSTMVNSLSTGSFDEDTIPTIGFNHRKMKKGKPSTNSGKINMTLWDLGGQSRFRESWEKYCRDSDVIIFVVDSCDKGTLSVEFSEHRYSQSEPPRPALPLESEGHPAVGAGQ